VADETKKRNRKKPELTVVGEQQAEPPKIGRPPIQIDPEIVKNLAMIQCTTEEIASVLGVSKDTLERRFAATIKEGRETGRSSLRRHMWKKVEGGNVVMMIWLSKQILGMRDKVDQKIETPRVPEIDYSKYSDQELASLEALVRKGQPALAPEEVDIEQ